MSEGKTSQVLQIQPAKELSFQGPFTDVVTSYMTLRNPTTQAVAFKVKTTAPKQYCVRPNSGIIPPGDAKTVTVMLQPMDGIPSDANRHKFMVQSCVSPSPDMNDLDSLWKVVNASDLMYSKLMVVFNDKSSGDGTTDFGSGKEEVPASVNYANVEATAATNISSDQTDIVGLKKLLKATDEEKRNAIRKIDSMQQEIDDLFRKNRKLQQQMEGIGEAGLPTLQIVLMALAALFVGLIIGKMI